jgi:hypothetical protein
MKVPFHAYEKENGFWYWFDETKAESLPYKTREAAEESIERYRDCFLRPWTPGRRDRRRNPYPQNSNWLDYTESQIRTLERLGNGSDAELNGLQLALVRSRK